MATPRQTWNATIERFVNRQHESMKLSSDDSQTTWGSQPFHLESAPEKEHAAAPFHALLLALAALVAPSMIRQSSSWGIYWFVLVGAFAAFCVVLKWQPWHSRLHLPLFALGGVAVGSFLSRSYIRVTSPLIVAGLVGSALPALIASEYRTLAGSVGLNVFHRDSESLRFLGHEDVRCDAERIAQKVEDAASVDLVNHGASPWEYPLTRLLKRAHNSPRVGYFYPVAGSPRTEAADVVIDIGDHPGPPLIRHATGRVYRAAEVIGPFTLYRPLPLDARIGENEILDHAVGRFGIGAEPPTQR
jgi:hypothetical protein